MNKEYLFKIKLCLKYRFLYKASDYTGMFYEEIKAIFFIITHYSILLNIQYFNKDKLYELILKNAIIIIPLWRKN